MIRQLHSDDFEILYDLLRPYFDESFLNESSKFSPENSATFLLNALTSESHYVAGAIVDKKLVGISIAEIYYEFRIDPEGYIPIFYVEPDQRGKGIARALAAHTIDVVKAANVASISTAAMSIFHGNNNQLYDNLFGKFGFEKVSNLLMWRR